MRTEITRQDEEKFLVFKIAKNKIFDGPASFDEIIECISTGGLLLEVSEEEGTKIIDDSALEEIKRVIPYLRKIVDKPRSFIKSLEEKVPVETAKRINHKAVMKLSRDSNDWYARTVLSVKPKNIVSDVNEETIDLYENRFICSLIDLIGELLVEARQHYRNEIKLFDDNSAINAINKEYNYTTASFPFFNKITKRNAYNNQDSDFRQKLSDELNAVKKQENRIIALKRSDFYRTLHKKKKVSDPIQKTNILMFEFNYNQAYKLWKYLKQLHQEEKLSFDVEFTEEELQRHYVLYSMLCVFAALNDMGFRETSGGKLNYADCVVSLDKQFVFSKDKLLLNLSYYNDGIHIRYCYSKEKKKWDEFILFPRYTNFELLSRTQIEEHTTCILDSFIDNTKFSEVSSRYAFVSVNLNRYSENKNLSNKVYRRFYGIGNNYSEDESDEHLKNWADYKTGIIILTPTDLRSNFLRIEKIINYHLIKWIKVDSSLVKCPLCGSNNISAGNDNSITCYGCSHHFSITNCNHCDKEHKKPIVWVKYLNDKFLRNEDVIRGLSEMSPYYKMSKIETIMGEKATTAFDIVKETSGWKLKTICPYCGVQLGDTK